MALVANGYRLGHSPFRHVGGALVSIYGASRAMRNMGELPGRMRGIGWITSEISALPHGALAPNAWMLPRKPGAIASRNVTTIALGATGSVSRGLPVEGDASITIGATGSAIAVGAVEGSASIAIGAVGDAYGQAAIAGSAAIALGASGDVTATAFLSGSANISISAAATMGCTATVAGDAYLSAAAEGATLTEAGIAAAVLSGMTAAGVTPDDIAEAVYEYHTTTVTAMHS